MKLPTPNPLAGVAASVLDQPLPRIPTALNAAQWAYERIATHIKEFEDALDPNDEIGYRIVSTPDAVMHVEDIGYHGPDMLIFYGKNEHGKSMELMQHVTQMNVLLTAVPKLDNEARRIGFHLVQKLAQSSDGS